MVGVNYVTITSNINVKDRKTNEIFMNTNFVMLYFNQDSLNDKILQYRSFSNKKMWSTG